jgi:tRNA modification GTPase
MDYVIDDTIAAIATAPGAAGLAVVRLSGPGALAIASRAFRGAALDEVATHTLHHGWVIRSDAGGAGVVADANARRVDEVVAAVFRAPRSYTREDVVELSCHGGRVSAEGVLAAVLAAGARLAAPGEFSLRAFLNGRIDLAQAEAVCDVIHADSGAAHALALAQLAGDLSGRLESLADALADAAAEIEARVDFAEDVGGVEVPPHVVAAIERARAALDDLLAGAAYARAVREGARVPIVGRPNVGKSSLFNALVGEERAIVSATPGTTRDRVSESIDLDGVRVTLSDTAGIRDGGEAIESEGIARTETFVDSSPVVLWVIDAAAPLEAGDARVAARLAGKRLVVALNKCDAGRQVCGADVERMVDAATACVPVSATRGAGLAALRSELLAALAGGSLGAGSGVNGGAPPVAASNPRHIESLGHARAALERATALAVDGAPGEIVAIEIHEASRAIGEILGRDVGADLLDRIFGRFCIGK